MNTIELRKELIDKISVIEDVDLLKSIKEILEYEHKERIINLSPEQKKELLHASEEGKKGNYISQSELDHRIEKCLEEK